MGQSAAIKGRRQNIRQKNVIRTAKPDKYKKLRLPAVRETKKQIKERKMRLKQAIKRLSNTKGAIRGIKR